MIPGLYSSDNVLAEMELVRDLIRRSIHTCIPAQIEKYDSKKQLADVRILLTPFYSGSVDFRNREDGKETRMVEELGICPPGPLLCSRPVIFPYSAVSGLSMTFPLKEGDEVLVLFSELGFERLRKEFSKYSPEEKKEHQTAFTDTPDGFPNFSLSNGIVLPGFFSTIPEGDSKSEIEDFQEDAIELRDRKRTNLLGLKIGEKPQTYMKSTYVSPSSPNFKSVSEITGYTEVVQEESGGESYHPRITIRSGFYSKEEYSHGVTISIDGNGVNKSLLCYDGKEEPVTDKGFLVQFEDNDIALVREKEEGKTDLIHPVSLSLVNSNINLRALRFVFHPYSSDRYNDNALEIKDQGLEITDKGNRVIQLKRTDHLAGSIELYKENKNTVRISSGQNEKQSGSGSIELFCDGSSVLARLATKKREQEDQEIFGEKFLELKAAGSSNISAGENLILDVSNSLYINRRKGKTTTIAINGKTYVFSNGILIETEE